LNSPIYAAFAAKDALIAPTRACSAGLEYLAQERVHFAVDISECIDGGGSCTTPECDQYPCHSHAVLGMNVAVFDAWLSFVESGTLPNTSDNVRSNRRRVCVIRRGRHGTRRATRCAPAAAASLACRSEVRSFTRENRS
jgi:hypothetical protein